MAGIVWVMIEPVHVRHKASTVFLVLIVRKGKLLCVIYCAMSCNSTKLHKFPPAQFSLSGYSASSLNLVILILLLLVSLLAGSHY